MKELTIQDATKDELIQYFFAPDGFEGGFRNPCSQDDFLLWLKLKRNSDLLDAIDSIMDASLKAFREYIELIQQMNAEKDIDKKMEISGKAVKVYERYERAEKLKANLEKKLGY